MDIYPAIDLYQGKAVRLYKGDYAQMTVYSEDPPSVARDFAAAGAHPAGHTAAGRPGDKKRAPGGALFASVFHSSVTGREQAPFWQI